MISIIYLCHWLHKWTSHRWCILWYGLANISSHLLLLRLCLNAVSSIIYERLLRLCFYLVNVFSPCIFNNTWYRPVYVLRIPSSRLLSNSTRNNIIIWLCYWWYFFRINKSVFRHYHSIIFSVFINSVLIWSRSTNLYSYLLYSYYTYCSWIYLSSGYFIFAWKVWFHIRILSCIVFWIGILVNWKVWSRWRFSNINVL